MRLSPDAWLLWQHDPVRVTGTLVFTWVVMLVLVLGSRLITRRLTTDLAPSRFQSALEIVVTTIEGQIAEVGIANPRRYIGFLGTLFLFVATSALFTIVPGFDPPTASLSTTVALAASVFVAVPLYGVRDQGLRRYLKSYAEPTLVMLPFNVISELSRTLALAVRLFGNMMSGGMLIAILLTVTPLLFPVVMTVLGLLTGMVQAYIFTILAAVYIAAALRAQRPASEPRSADPSAV